MENNIFDQIVRQKRGGWIGLLTLLEKTMLLVFFTFMVTNHLLANVETEYSKSQFNLSAETVGETTSSSNRSHISKKKKIRGNIVRYIIYINTKKVRARSFSNQT